MPSPRRPQHFFNGLSALNPTIIKRNRVNVGTGHESPTAGHRAKDPQASAHAKHVRLLEHEGRVRAIELTCSCGDVSVIELDYPDAPRPQEVTA